MKMFAVACLLLVVAGSLAGCTSTSIALQDLDADMPKVLVRRYPAAKTPYADEGNFWLPLVALDRARVSVTEDGFHAERFGGVGPLMLLLMAGASSDFDQEGRLIRHSAIGGTIWGLLFLENTSMDREKEESSYRFRILFGALGYRETSDHAKTFYLLYIPIPISRGDGSRSSVKTPAGKEGNTESAEQEPAIPASP